VQAGKIYVAPPNVHLLLEDGHIRLHDGPRENRVRPAADPLFRSASRTYASRVVGVVLSGTDADGSLGLEAIRLRGGLGIAQDPKEAAFSGMPTSAIERSVVDYVLPVRDIPALLVALATDGTQEGGPATVSGDIHEQHEPSGAGELPLATEKEEGQASGLTCPDCFGSIWLLPEGHLVSLECRVGHRYNTRAFMAAQSARVEDALWTAINVLRERATTLRRLGPYDPSSGQQASSYHEERARELEEQAATIHTLVTQLIASDAAEPA
jgi:two-component system chemotaxis response regulator CheB